MPIEVLKPKFLQPFGLLQSTVRNSRLKQKSDSRDTPMTTHNVFFCLEYVRFMEYKVFIRLVMPRSCYAQDSDKQTFCRTQC